MDRQCGRDISHIIRRQNAGMVNRLSSIEEDVMDQLQRAGFRVRAGSLHGSWHMIAERDQERFAVSGSNAVSVARTLLKACAVHLERRRSLAEATITG